jgi:hypothetical protein
MRIITQCKTTLERLRNSLVRVGNDASTARFALASRDTRRLIYNLDEDDSTACFAQHPPSYNIWIVLEECKLTQVQTFGSFFFFWIGPSSHNIHHAQHVDRNV